MNQTKLDVYETAILRDETFHSDELGYGVITGLQAMALLKDLEEKGDERNYNFLRNMAATNVCIDRVFTKIGV